MRIIRERDVKQVTGLSRTARWRLEGEGLFPVRLRIGKRATGWLEDEVQEWIASRQRVHSMGKILSVRCPDEPTGK